MSIYTLTEEDLPVFESLKTFPFNEEDFGPWETHYKKYLHPRFGVSHTEQTKRLMSEAWKHRKYQIKPRKRCLTLNLEQRIQCSVRKDQTRQNS
jgi:hypothetical protein